MRTAAITVAVVVAAIAADVAVARPWFGVGVAAGLAVAALDRLLAAGRGRHR